MSDFDQRLKSGFGGVRRQDSLMEWEDIKNYKLNVCYSRKNKTYAIRSTIEETTTNTVQINRNQLTNKQNETKKK